MNKNILISIISLSILALSEIAYASILEEVVVTARRKAENLQNVPMAVTNYSGELLKDIGISDIGGIGSITPSLTFARSPGQGVNPIVSLRGQVQNDPSVLTLDPSVGIYMDDVYLGRSPGSLLEMFDVERVEVLKGPQGTLYGRNMTGGALKVIPVKAEPSADFSGFVGGKVGNYGSRTLEGAVNIPLMEKLAARVGASQRKSNGYGRLSLYAGDDINNKIGERETGGKDALMYRGNLLWLMTENITFDIGYDYSNTETNGSPFYDVAGDKATESPLGTQYERTKGGDYTYSSDVDSKANALTKGWYIKSDLSNKWFDTKVIYAERVMDYYFIIDPDGTSARGVVQQSYQTVDQESFELQVSGGFWEDKFSYLFGYFNFKETGHDSSQTLVTEVVAGALLGGDTLPPGIGGLLTSLPADLGNPGTPPLVPPGTVILADRDVNGGILNESESAFVQLTYDMNEAFSFTVGGRAIQETKGLDIDGRDYGLANYLLGPGLQPGTTPNCMYQPGADGVTNDGSTCRFANSTDYDYNVYMLSADWRLNTSLMFYAKKSTGSRSGGQNFRGSDQATLAPFDPEFIEDLEVGSKADFFDGAARLNVSIFRSDYTDIQFSDIVGVSTFVENLGDAKIDGIEVELFMSLTENTGVILTGNLVNFEYDDDSKVGPYVPDEKYSLILNYKRPYSWGELGSNLITSYSAAVALDNDKSAFENNADTRQDPYVLVNISGYIEFYKPSIKVAASVTNLTNEVYRLNAVPSFTKTSSTEGAVVSLGEPKLYSLDLTYSF
jgi:iron complex outermembrane receptor protein